MCEPASGPGITRLGYSALERKAHEIFQSYMAGLGLEVSTDAAGNSIAELPGQDPSLPAIGTGSHLDSVPNGGAFDGIAGVVAAMEVARTLSTASQPPRHPIRFVAFAAEEGARFGQACTGSRIISGLTKARDLPALLDQDGISVAQAMAALGIDPLAVEKAQWNPDDWAGFIELHIEQGSVLTDAGMPIGVVDLISGSTRIKIEIKGRASHTGGTPMHLRADALAAASEIVLAAESLANDPGHHGTRITVGKMDVFPGSITTIPGECQLHIDVRDTDPARQRVSTSELISRAYDIASSRKTEINVEILADASPVILPIAIRNAITTSAASQGIEYRVMPSGASHDTQMINHVCPSGMIFVPSQNHGVSHSPDELTTYSDLAVGIDLLTVSLRELDSSLNTQNSH
ncbi:putative allantoate deiminase [Glutamicibacter arilaitensis Re117]|uniref:Allantoate deiminase n=1 Tax=Glutamicibacter arilaitensis (strain DSM 16368 / CIP 108037 / IAM 15318 / JCM 13566 / NCIMB 14258 / Re117) TaxID=861360 RepID=A0ABP1U996_GLUAR|nr:putative allantoate deiminase [Glutamicibacter arilaitensis Re117]